VAAKKSPRATTATKVKPAAAAAAGRMPPALPKLKGALAKAVAEIAACEKLGFFDTAQAEARRTKLKLTRKDATALLAAIGEDVGEVPPSPDITKIKPYEVYVKAAKAFGRIETASLERQATLARLRALAAPKKGAVKKKSKAKATAKAKPKKKKLVMRKVPLDAAKLDDEKGREELLDAIGAWIVDALDGASDDAARAAIAGAISAFSDVREAAGQERGEYAGHFFMVDAVGLDNTDRPVPWNVLQKRVGMERLGELSVLFDEVLPKVR
jgi:hypothetical protein